MATHLGFLRAINLGATRVFPKDDIRRVTEEAGFDNVQTHINTGNIRFETRMRSRTKIEQTLERAFAADRGFEVLTITFRADEFAALAADALDVSAAHPGLARHYVYLLKDELDGDLAARVEGLATPAGRMLVRGRAVHALLLPGYRDGTVDPLGAAKLLGVATNRNVGVVMTLAERWC
ncbi:DUF1697 domain-containing protein [Microbacterium sp. cf332]|uniref:DUF1697 domain-containing protein n=1 Tax=Microbacterium sp. cf332 TaxID=1761804 RepID=UPI00088C63D2|nr:DUF1697 domain-containing protein [Microbacterium sp. cf332]SDQ62632.1 Uncharacterized conserved protein, DUF1697 family [Microbacterium sp. cf332]